MSKSHPDPASRIQLDDDPEQIAKKISFALTDSIEGVSYDPVARPGVSNLLDIMSYLHPEGKLPSELAEAYSGFSMRALKDEVTTSITTSLIDIQQNYNHLIKDDDSHYLEDIAREGSRKAQTKATDTTASVRKSLGFQDRG